MILRQHSPGLLAVALYLLASNQSAAQTPLSVPSPPAAMEVEALENQSNQLRQQQRPAEALVLLRRAYDQAHLPRTLARIALAETALGMWIAAETHLREALRAEGDAWILQNRSVLQATMATIGTHLASLEVYCDAPGAEVWMEGRLVSGLPLAAPLRVVSGTTPIEIRAAGYHSVVRQVTVDSARIARETVVLTPIAATVPPPAVTVPPPTVTATNSPVPVASAVSRVTHASPAPTAGTFTGPLGIGLLAGGGAGIVVGIVGAVIRDGYVQRFNEDPSCGALTLNGVGPCQDHSDGVDRSTAVAALGFSLGGLLVAGGTVLLLTRATPRGSPPPVRVSAGPGEISVGLSGSF